MAAAWSLAFAAFGYAIALKTGNPAAVQSSFLLFFPFLFLTTAYVPRDKLTPVAAARRRVEPGHLHPPGPALAGPRRDGTARTSASAALAIGIVAVLSMAMCFKALAGRVKQS